MNMPVVVALAAAKATTLAWWGFHLVRTRSISRANRAFADDWDALESYGKDVVALAKAVHGLNGLEASDFKSFATTVGRSKKMLARLPLSTRQFLEQRFRLSSVLEEESRLAYAHYAATLVNDESGKPQERLGRIYNALYIMGRVDWPLDRNTADGAYIKLMHLHKVRVMYKRDKRMLSALEGLRTANIPEFLLALKSYLHLTAKRRVWPAYIAHAFMPNSQGQLDHRGVADEIAAKYGVKKS